MGHRSQLLLALPHVDRQELPGGVVDQDAALQQAVAEVLGRRHRGWKVMRKSLMRGGDIGDIGDVGDVGDIGDMQWVAVP